MRLTTRLYKMTYQLIFLKERYSRMARHADLSLIHVDSQLGASMKVSKEPMKVNTSKPQEQFTF